MSANDNKTTELNRRAVLCSMCVLGLGTRVPLAQAQDASPPRPGDLLAHAYGSKAGQAIGVDELAVATQQVFAFPADPLTGAMRSGNRLNQIALVRLDPATMTPATAARSVNGLVAYSGVCSHTGCDVTDWNGEFKRFQCPCHESQFDPADGARVVGGPAPWQLAALPLKEVDGKVAVAAEFEGRLGFPQPGASPFGI